MNVLVACEESQAVTKEFRKRGHNAFSCDIQECSGGCPEWHICDDVIPLLNNKNKDRNITFRTSDGKLHELYKWDMIIAFPPCTYFTTAGACRMYHKDANGVSHIDLDRYNIMLKFRELFMSIYNDDCDKICIENPTPMKIAELPKHSQVIQPYYFGHPYTKRTFLWLKGLRDLKNTDIVEPVLGSWVNGDSSAYKRKGKENIHGKSTAIERSKTFLGVAKAMAEQWG